MTEFNYIAWLTTFLVIPTTAIWVLFFKTLRKYSLAILAITIVVQAGIAWDLWGVNSGLWFFPDGNNLGISVLGMPLEEYLAFILFGLFVSSLSVVLRFHWQVETKKGGKK